MSKIYVIHENDAWTDPLIQALASQGSPSEFWFLDRGQISVNDNPPDGVFYNRMSASSHTRDHRYAPEYTSGVLAWLASHGRWVVNSSRALQLEISKVAQYAALNAHGIRTPQTIAAIGREEIVRAAGNFNGSFITKHNRGGRGLGVHLFQSVDALQEYVSSDRFEPSIDGITLIQDYIEAPQPYVTRAEFVGGRFLYAVRVDTSEGFELCPADVCQVGGVADSPAHPKFSIIDDFSHPIIGRYERFLRANDIHIAGIEFIVSKSGELLTYDVNTNTNYNSDAEKEAGKFGMTEIARYLGRELACLLDPECNRTLLVANTA